ncbi:hypothetical protein QWY14_03460 [Planococcus sp. N028]|uniref:Uncharacterized protein n=1 Tax=Planococcus shixiaomingii TaxID=3058393 RepID=A0ABT8MZG8_9BACL|nr:hypothetical protein [Planococcus sp. N028]MDN7240829.1 hypothetical protein [Planococcus sp. N028]
MIKNMAMLIGHIKNFSYSNIKCITNFNLSFVKDFDVYSSLLDIDFMMESKGDSYLLQFRFRDPQNIKFESLGYFQPVGLAVHDLRNKGWENIKFEVEDYENDSLKFYCSEIELISVTKTSLVIE